MSSILRRDYLAGVARVGANGDLIASGGRILSSVRTGAGIYELGLENVDPNAHVIHARPVSSATQNLGVNLEPVSNDLLRVRTVSGNNAKFSYYSALLNSYSDLFYYNGFPDLSAYGQFLVAYWVKQDTAWGQSGFAMHICKGYLTTVGPFATANFHIFADAGGFLNVRTQRSDGAISNVFTTLSNYLPDTWYFNMVSFDLTNVDPAQRIRVWRGVGGVVSEMVMGAGLFPTTSVFPTTNPLAIGGQDVSSAGNTTPVRIDEPAIWLSKIGSLALATELYNGGTPRDLVTSTLGQPDFWPRVENNFADSGTLGLAPITVGAPAFSTDVPFAGIPIAAQDTEFVIAARRTKDA